MVLDFNTFNLGFILVFFYLPVPPSCLKNNGANPGIRAKKRPFPAGKGLFG